MEISENELQAYLQAERNRLCSYLAKCGDMGAVGTIRSLGSGSSTALADAVRRARLEEHALTCSGLVQIPSEPFGAGVPHPCGCKCGCDAQCQRLAELRRKP